MQTWYMVTVVGRDRPGIVARVSQALYRGGCQLGEAAMMRLGGNFTMMFMVRPPGGVDLEALLAEPAAALSLRVHVDPIEGRLHDHVAPNLRVDVHGADRPGIVAQVTAALAEAGANILDLASDVAGSDAAPIYIMHIEARCAGGVEAVEAALAPLRGQGIEVHVSGIETLIG